MKGESHAGRRPIPARDRGRKRFTELFARLAECRGKLPPPMIEALRVTYDEGRSSDEAATLLSVNAAAFRKRLELKSNKKGERYESQY